MKVARKTLIALTVVALISGLAFVICGFLAVFLVRDWILNIVHSRLPLVEGSDTVEAFINPPVDPYFRAYFFNFTNPKAFLEEGAKPRLQEVGPFTYRVKWTKIDVVWVDDDTAIEFKPVKTYHFVRELSVGPDTDVLQLPNLPLASAVKSTTSTTGEAKDDLLVTGLGPLLGILEQKPVEVVSVKDILWGYFHPLTELSRDLLPPEEQYPFEEYGLFSNVNATDSGLHKISSGIGDLATIGDVEAYEGKAELSYWSGPKCNAITGTDGSTFHPDIRKNETLSVFNKDLCQSLPLVYEKEADVGGIKAYRFTPPADVFAPPEENPSRSCFCNRETRAGCNIPRGLFDASPCKFGSPVLLSWPHFFQADPKLLDAVDGLKPVKEKHQMYIDIQPSLGKTVAAEIRSQVNVKFSKAENISGLEGLRDIIVPIMWFSESLKVEDEDVLASIRYGANAPQSVSRIMTVVGFVCGALLLVLGIIFLAVAKGTLNLPLVKVKESSNFS